MSFASPFLLGPFRVDATGHLSARDPARPPAFGFAWRGRPMHARLCESAVELSAVLGRVPSTARAESVTRRPRSFATLRDLRHFLPDEWRLALRADHRICVETVAALPTPITAAALLTLLAGFALALEPYLDLLEEDGVEPPSGDGSASTCPG